MFFLNKELNICLVQLLYNFFFQTLINYSCLTNFFLDLKTLRYSLKFMHAEIFVPNKFVEMHILIVELIPINLKCVSIYKQYEFFGLLGP